MVSDTIEVWRAVPGYSRYEVSDAGRVRSLCRAVPRVLRPSQNRSGYLVVGIGGRGYFVHRLVAMTFLRPASPDHKEVNHRNGVHTDNRLVNLEWMTRAENLQHAAEVLGYTDIFVSKLSAAQRQEIRERLAQGEYATELCFEYDVSKETIYRCAR